MGKLGTALHNATVAAASTTTSGGGPAPSAADISRVLSVDTSQAEYIIQQDNVIEEAFGHLECYAALVYAHGGDADGVLAATVALITYLGRVRKYLTEIRSQGSQDTPVLISETSESRKQSCRMFVKGKAGDRLLLIYR